MKHVEVSYQACWSPMKHVKVSKDNNIFVSSNVDLDNLFGPFSNQGWIRKPLFSTHRIDSSTPQICYIHILGVEYRSLRYIPPPQNLSPDIRHKTPYVKSSVIYLASAIHLLPVETHPSVQNRILLGFVFSEILWDNVHVSPDGIIFLLPFPVPLSYFISLPLIRSGTAFHSDGTSNITFSATSTSLSWC